MSKEERLLLLILDEFLEERKDVAFELIREFNVTLFMECEMDGDYLIATRVLEKDKNLIDDPENTTRVRPIFSYIDSLIEDDKKKCDRYLYCTVVKMDNVIAVVVQLDNISSVPEGFISYLCKQ